MELAQRFRRPPKLFSSVDATAFASILVVVVFAVWVFQGMSYNPHHGNSVDLPRVLHPVAMRSALRDDAMKVTITRDGRIYFGTEQVHFSDLPAKIQGRLKDREVEHKVYIVADMRTRWAGVKLALDGVRSAGIIRVAFLADEGRLPKLTY